MDIVSFVAAFGGGAVLSGAILSHTYLKNVKPLEEQKQTEEKEKRMPKSTPIEIDSAVTERLDALEDLLENEPSIHVSTKWVTVRVLTVQEGIRYHFHYLDRHQPYVTLTYHVETNQVTHDYIKETLKQDKRRLKRIIARLSENIVEQQTKEIEQESGLDALLRKAHLLLRSLKKHELTLLPSEFTSLQEQVQALIDAYEPLKEETKQKHQDAIFLALETIEQRMQQTMAKKNVLT